MAAYNADYRNKAQKIGIKENTGKAVFVKREADPVKLLEVPVKVDAEHQAEEPDSVHNSRGDSYKISQKVKLFFEVKIRFGMYSVKHKEADEHMKEAQHA